MSAIVPPGAKTRDNELFKKEHAPPDPLPDQLTGWFVLVVADEH